MSAFVVREVEDAWAIVRADRLDDFEPAWFDRAAWEASGARRHSSTGRTPVLICERPTESWVLRHYSRGGLVARFIDDTYWWRGLEATRAWRELEVLEQLHRWRLPAPEPVAGLVCRTALVYRADMITVYIPGTQTLSALLRTEPVAESLWRRIGEMLGAFHARGIDHPDITAHNILIDSQDQTFLVDFDNAVIRVPGRWCRRGIARFQRSLRKVAMETGGSFSPQEWLAVVAGYDAVVREYGSG